jgi:hypothetical protein
MCQGTYTLPWMVPKRLLPTLPPCNHRSIVRDGWHEHAFDAKVLAGLDKLNEEDLATLYAILKKAKQ